MKNNIYINSLSRRLAVEKDIFSNIDIVNELEELGIFDNMNMYYLELRIKKEQRKLKLEKLYEI